MGERVIDIQRDSVEYLFDLTASSFDALLDGVAAGDTIAAAGDSGGSGRTELYFEIRKGGKPVDPRPWFKAADP